MKKILDACCGSRMCWFDKDNPDTVFMDCRSEEHTLCDGRRLEIRPDVVGDFRKMPFPDNSFYLVLFDPPHLNNLGESSWLAKKYGRLLPSWEDDIRQGFEECMRVLKPNGTLIFKDYDGNISVSLASNQPTSGRDADLNLLGAFHSISRFLRNTSISFCRLCRTYARIGAFVSGPEIRQIGFIREPTGEIEDEDNE